MRVLVIDPKGYALDFAMRCKAHGHDVRMFVQSGLRGEDIGRGFVEITRDWRGWLRWADLIFLADNIRLLPEIDQFRRDNPHATVISATEESARLELERDAGQALFDRCGIKTLPYKTFTDYDAAIAYVIRQDRRFVSKPIGDADKAMSYVAKSPEDLVYMLQRWKKARAIKGEFMLQDFQPGVEMAVGGWLGPNGFIRGWCENFEFKKLMCGDKGCNTGEMGTVLRYTGASKLAARVLAPLEDALIATRHCGYVDVNCIIDDAGIPWPLEFTCRPGWPTFNIQQQLHEEPVEWLKTLAEGRDPKSFAADWIALGVVLAIPDYPYSKTTAKDVKGIPVTGPPIQDWLANIHPCEMMMGTAPARIAGKVRMDHPAMVTAGDYVLVAAAGGTTVRAAKRAAYKALEEVRIPNSPMYRTDIGDRLKEQLPLIQAAGYARNLNY